MFKRETTISIPPGSAQPSQVNIGKALFFGAMDQTMWGPEAVTHSGSRNKHSCNMQVPGQILDLKIVLQMGVPTDFCSRCTYATCMYIFIEVHIDMYIDEYEHSISLCACVFTHMNLWVSRQTHALLAGKLWSNLRCWE